jgi:hypothetical protein
MPPWQQPEIITYSKHMADSYARWTGRTLIDAPPKALAQALYHAPFALVSHHAAPDPVFRYANVTAQNLWKLSWEEFVTMPSRHSAEPDAQGEREWLLARAGGHGYVDDYSGIRISSDKQRFRIEDCILWNVLDDSERKIGQAACFATWDYL